MQVNKIALVFLGLISSLSGTANNYPDINRQNIEIIRDSFGVAHIYAKTDAEAAFGLAWANAEDAFHLMQEPMLLAKGMMGRVHGPEGAAADFFAHAIGARDFVELNFEKQTSEEFREYLNGFVQGVNAYADAHPKEWLHKKLFPITSKDVMTAFVVSSSFLSGAGDPFESIYNGEYDGREVEKTKGSNAFAFAPHKTEDGLTYLTINPHFAMEGQFTFYEAHIASEEGLNFSGVGFQGLSSLAMGNNPNIGYGMTWNHFDKVDVYKLKMHENLDLVYQVDGKFFKLEERPISLKVKLGFIVIPIKKTSYWSGFGPTIKSKNGEFYALRFPANFNMKIGEQLYFMNKATNLADFKEALRIQGLMMFNIVYADKEGNIFYTSFGLAPDRPEGWDYSGVLPGDTTAAMWRHLIPVDSLPQVLNPDCGFVLNCNNSPFHATCDGQNDNPDRLPDYLDLRPGDNNRSIRLFEQIYQEDKVSFEEMKAMKFDARFSVHSKFWKSLELLFEMDLNKYPDIKDIHALLISWDRNATTSSTGTTIFALTLNHIFERKGYGDDKFIFGLDETESEFAQALQASKDWLLKYYGDIKVPFGEIHRIKRLEKDLPCPGFPDALAAAYGKEKKKTGKFYPLYGDTYTHFVAFSENGVEQMETLTPYGASFKEDSPHYNDQMEPFVNRNMKKMSLDKEYWLDRAERVYHPGI